MALPQIRSGLPWGQQAITLINNAIGKIVDASTTVAGLVKLATNSDTVTGTATDTATTPAGVKAAIDAAKAAITPIGKHKIWVPVSQMRLDASSAPASADVTATNIQYQVYDFDQTSVEQVHFNISMPSSWNEGTVTFVPVWTAAAGTGDVVWRLNGYAASNDDAIAFTYTTSANSTDTLIATGDLHRGPESSALTIDGTPAANDTVFFRALRVANNAGDTLNADARLLGYELYITTAAAVDVA